MVIRSRHLIDISMKTGATRLSKLETLLALCTDLLSYVVLVTWPSIRLPYPFLGRAVV
jgi:hypothetical protein